MRFLPPLIVLLLLAPAIFPARAEAVCNASACDASTLLTNPACCTASACTIDGTLTVTGPTCTFDFDGKSLTVSPSGKIDAQGKTLALKAKSMKVTGLIDVRGPSGANGGSVTITTMGMTGLAYSQEGGTSAIIDASSTVGTGGKIFIHADGPVSLSKGTVKADGGPAAPGGVIEITTTSGDVSIQNLLTALQATPPPAGQRGGEITIIGPGNVAVGGSGRLVADDGSINISLGLNATFADGAVLQSNLGGSIIITAASVAGFSELRANGDFGLVNIEATDGPLLLQRSTSGIAVGPSGGVDLSTDSTVPDGTLTMAMPIFANGASVDISSAGSLIVNGKIETTGIVDSGADDVSLSADAGDIMISKAIVTSDAFNVGKIDIDSPSGKITIAGNLEAKGSLEADGGDITITAGDDLTLQGDISLNASGADTSGGGDLDLEATGDLVVGASVELITDGSLDPTSDAGSVMLLAGLEGVAERLPGNVTLSGKIDANGHASTGGNQVTISGCVVSIPTGGGIDITGDPASNTFITARKSLTIGGQVKSAGPNVVEFAAGSPPLITGTVTPAVNPGTCANGTPVSGCSRPPCVANGMPAGCLYRCPTCGDSVMEFPESCDVGPNGPFCSSGDFCDAQCRLRDCDDGQFCTNDSCDPATGCVHTSKTNGTSCSDNNVCNGVEACSNGVCIATPGTTPDCNDNNPCTTDACNTQSGCTHTNLTGPGGPGCDDNDFCNGVETCSAGACIAGTPCPSGTICNPGNHQCDPAGSCQSAADCNDGNPCTTDACQGSTCANTPKPDQTSCDDGNLCNGERKCIGGVCQPASPPNCNDNNPCTTDTCDPASGCHNTSCDDNNACTTDTCDGATSTCQHATLSCADNNPCTTDSCSPQTGCAHSPPDPACHPCVDASDCPPPVPANVCADTACIDGACQYPLSSICCTGDNDCIDADLNPCTGPATCLPTHRCNAAPHLPDGPQPGCGTTCTPGTCQSGTCAAPTPLDCNDNNPCTADVCLDVQGCTHPPIPLCCNATSECIDQKFCTECDLEASRCTDVPPGEACPCSGTDPFACGPRCMTACVNGRCDSDVVANCDDNNPCTTDACDPTAGCTNTPQDGGGVAGCDDGQACNGAEQCVGGTCQHAAVPECDDDDLCTDDTCEDATGCVNTGKTSWDAIGCRLDSMAAVLDGAGSGIPTKLNTKLHKKVGAFTKKLTTARNPALKCTKAKRQLTALARQLRAFQKSVNRMIGRHIEPSVGTPLADLAGKAAKAADDQRAGLGC